MFFEGEIRIKQKATSLTAIIFILALIFTVSPALAISPIIRHRMIFRGYVGAGYVGGGSPIIKVANGSAIAFVYDNPDKAKVIAFCEIPTDNLEFRVLLVSLHTVDPVRFYEDHMILWGYFDVYVNGTLLYDDEFGYFTFNWEGGFWGLLVGTPVTDVKAYVSGLPIMYRIW